MTRCPFRLSHLSVFLYKPLSNMNETKLQKQKYVWSPWFFALKKENVVHSYEAKSALKSQLLSWGLVYGTCTVVGTVSTQYVGVTIYIIILSKILKTVWTVGVPVLTVLLSLVVIYLSYIIWTFYYVMNYCHSIKNYWHFKIKVFE